MKCSIKGCNGEPEIFLQRKDLRFCRDHAEAIGLMKKENVQEETSEEREKRLERAFLDIQEAGYDEGYDDAEQGEPRRTELS